MVLMDKIEQVSMDSILTAKGRAEWRGAGVPLLMGPSYQHGPSYQALPQ